MTLKMTKSGPWDENRFDCKVRTRFPFNFCKSLIKRTRCIRPENNSSSKNRSSRNRWRASVYQIDDIYIITGSQSLTISSNLPGGQRPGRHGSVEHDPRLQIPARCSLRLAAFRAEMSGSKGCAQGARQRCCIMIAGPVAQKCWVADRLQGSVVIQAWFWWREHFYGDDCLGPGVS